MKFLILALVVAIGLVRVQAQECKCDDDEKAAIKQVKQCIKQGKKPEKAELENDPTFSIQIAPEKPENETSEGKMSIQITKRDAFIEEKETNKRERRDLDEKNLKKECAEKYLKDIDCYKSIKSACETEKKPDKCVFKGVKKAIKKCRKENKGGKKNNDDDDNDENDDDDDEDELD